MATVKRYLLFVGMYDEPRGGANDFAQSFSTIDEAKGHYSEMGEDRLGWAHIFDIQELKIVQECMQHRKYIWEDYK